MRCWSKRTLFINCVFSSACAPLEIFFRTLRCSRNGDVPFHMPLVTRYLPFQGIWRLIHNLFWPLHPSSTKGFGLGAFKVWESSQHFAEFAIYISGSQWCWKCSSVLCFFFGGVEKDISEPKVVERSWFSGKKCCDIFSMIVVGLVVNWNNLCSIGTHFEGVTIHAYSIAPF